MGQNYKLKMYRALQLQKQNNSVYISLLSILLILLISSEDKPLSRIYNFDTPITNEELTEILITENIVAEDFIGGIQHSDNFKYKVKQIQEEARMYDIQPSFVFPKYQIKRLENVLPLKHKKFTTCVHQPFVYEYVMKIIGMNDCYYGADEVVLQKNSKIWKSSGNKFTIFFNDSIVPSYFSITFPSIPIPKQLNIFGFRIQQTTLAASKTLSSYHLVTIDQSNIQSFQNNVIYIPCKNSQCLLSYNFIMLMIDPIEIKQFGVFAST